jgi:hypothetical protein
MLFTTVHVQRIHCFSNFCKCLKNVNLSCCLIFTVFTLFRRFPTNDSAPAIVSIKLLQVNVMHLCQDNYNHNPMSR